MRKKAKAAFDPKRFLARVGEGKTVSSSRRDQIVFSQGEIADAVFYIHQSKQAKAGWRRWAADQVEGRH